MSWFLIYCLEVTGILKLSSSVVSILYYCSYQAKRRYLASKFDILVIHLDIYDILAAFRMTVWTWAFWMEQRVDRNRHHLLLWMYERSYCRRWTFSRKHNLLYFMLYQCNVQFHLQVYHYSSHGIADASCVAFQPCKLEV